MAEKRMFSNTIIDSDLFLDMPLTTQALYFHLCQRADDEGFVNNPKKILRMIGAAQDDLTLLITKGYVIVFESGVIVITHWNIHNTIRKDRLKLTFHKLEKEQLYIYNKVYSLEKKGESCQPNDNQLTTNCQPNDSIDKNRLDKNRIGKEKVVFLPEEKNCNKNQDKIIQWFDTVWDKYPEKKGKSKITKTKLDKLYKDRENVEIALDNYLNDKELKINGGWRNLKDGSTFFNNYKDYVNNENKKGKTKEEIFKKYGLKLN